MQTSNVLGAAILAALLIFGLFVASLANQAIDSAEANRTHVPDDLRAALISARQ